LFKRACPKLTRGSNTTFSGAFSSGSLLCGKYAPTTYVWAGRSVIGVVETQRYVPSNGAPVPAATVAEVSSVPSPAQMAMG
jgi:hypothetical protein